MKGWHTQYEVEKSKRLGKIAATLVVAAIILIAAALGLIHGVPDEDALEYEGTDYTLLEFPADIFMYDLKTGVEYNEDDGETVPVTGGQWDMVCNGGDIYCIDDGIDDATAYYNDDANYDWFVIIETDESEYTYPLEISMDDFEYIYEMDDMEKDFSVFFDEIETMGSLIKVSKDGIIRGTTCLAEYEGAWYWRTEIIDESREKDGDWPEYMIPLPVDVSEEIEGRTGYDK